MALHAAVDATLYKFDLREFIATEPYDVVMSFGLIEHFENPEDILYHHYRLCRTGGLLVVTIPHFRYLQWIYHFLFDRKDLERHNISTMNLETFKSFALNKGLNMRFLGYVGRINFWNYNNTGSPTIVMLRKGLSLGVRFLVNNLLSYILPSDKKLYAPWIVFVARKI